MTVRNNGPCCGTPDFHLACHSAPLLYAHAVRLRNRKTVAARRPQVAVLYLNDVHPLNPTDYEELRR